MTNTHPKTPPNLIPLPEAQPTPAFDSFMEELNVIRVEGRYFCFDVREAGRRKPALYSYVNKDGRRILIQTSINGHPSLLAYRILQLIFRQITLEGRPYPERVVFTNREISRLIGRKTWGGKDSKELLTALYQLQDTQIQIVADGEDNKTALPRFNLVSEVIPVIERRPDDPRRHGSLHVVAITLHKRIMDSIARGHIAIFNWGILETLEPIQAAFYKRLYVHLSNLYEIGGHRKDRLIFEKSYADICSEWLGGLAPYKYKSDILRQLKPHVDELARVGLLRSFAIETLVGGGWKLVFRPGKGFFQDYETFYRLKNLRQLQFTHTSNDIDHLQPIDVVSRFFEMLKGTARSEKEISTGDLDFARELLGQHSKEELFSFITYALEKAERQGFREKMQTFRAMKVYVADWEAIKVEQVRQATVNKAAALRQQREQFERAYEDFIRRHVDRYLSALSMDAAQALQDETERSVAATQERDMTFNFAVRRRIRERVLEKAPVPNFEDWMLTQTNSQK